MRKIAFTETVLRDAQQSQLATRMPFSDFEAILADIDKDEISRVVRNLLDNAVKYGKDGVVIGVSLIDDHDNLYIKFKDSGNGIELENLEFIFERFYREDKSRGTEYGGMGLGLAIANEIVKLHGGQISVDSEPGKGAAFNVSLPKENKKNLVERN